MPFVARVGTPGTGLGPCPSVGHPQTSGPAEGAGLTDDGSHARAGEAAAPCPTVYAMDFIGPLSCGCEIASLANRAVKRRHVAAERLDREVEIEGVFGYAVAASRRPSSSIAVSRSLNFWIFPVTVIGNSSVTRT